MPAFTQDQRNTIGAARKALTLVEQVSSEGSELLSALRMIDEQTIVNGNLDGPATFDAAVVRWGDIKTRLIAAAQALP